MKKIIRITAILMAVLMLTAFKDVPKKHWAYSVVQQAQEEKIVKGVTETLFEPDRFISKQEVALMLYRVHSGYSPEEDISAYAETYSMDLTTAGIASWAAPEIAYGFDKSYWTVNDFEGDGTGLATRELIARWTCSIDSSVFKNYGLRILPYNDASDIDPAYYSYVDTLYKHGIMQGTGDGKFQAKKNITRAELAAITVRTLNVCRKTSNYLQSNPFSYQYGTLSFSDVYSDRSFSLKSASANSESSVLVNISEDARILIDGNAASFDDLKLFEGKKISVSQYLLGNNIQSVWIQSKPFISGGIVESFCSVDAPDGLDDYDVVSVNVDGISIDLIKNSDTHILKNITPGNEVQFITDGIYLQEIE